MQMCVSINKYVAVFIMSCSIYKIYINTLMEYITLNIHYITKKFSILFRLQWQSILCLLLYLCIIIQDIYYFSAGITFAFAPGDLDSIVNDLNHNHVVSFEFKVATRSDSFLESMFAFLRTRNVSSDFSAPSPKQWFKNKALMSDVRLKAKQFTSFAQANKDDEDVKFVVTDSSEDDGIQDDKGALVLHYEFGSPEEFEPPDQPSKPTAAHVTHENVQLEWKQPQYGVQSIKSYTVLYRSTDDPPGDWKTQKTKQAETAITINQLVPQAEYVFKVRAECNFGSSEESKVSDIIKTKSSPVNAFMQYIIAQSTFLTPGPPVVYKLSVRPEFSGQHLAKMVFGNPTHPPKPNRVLMVVGATGAGKSTLINGIVNYLLGVKWENDFRFKLIADEVSQSQAHSQTQTITAYTFYWHEGSPLDFTLTVIDTPGFGDTRGLERDREITDHIQDFFSIKGKNGLDVLHGIGFVTQASLARLTPTQKYISDSILSIFGKDIQNNIFIMTTFADGAHPPVMGAINEAKIPYAEFFRFNNSALFENPKDSKFAKMFWEMGYSSFDDFFKHFGKADGVSLWMTRQVLDERKQLETIVNGIQPQINAGMSKIDELQQEELILKRRESEVLANKDFTYQVKVTKQRKIDAPRGVYVTTCAECHYTCHDNCIYDDDRDKWKCSAMSSQDINSTCRVCVGHCHWRKHYNNGYIFELYDEMETRTSQKLLERYNQAESAKANVESMISKMEDELHTLHQAVFCNIRQARNCLQRLNEIALKPNPLTEVEYIDLLIKSEEQQKKPGWTNRVKYFRQVREQAELLSKMTDQDAVDKMTQESSKSVWQWIAGKFTFRK